MASRKERARIAQQTLEILERGGYAHPAGAEVSIAAPLAAAQRGTILYTPARLAELAMCQRPAGEEQATRFAVENASTFAVARRLVQADPPLDPLCLNFASAKNPGGGFLGGSQAQEECLARASGLYACINPVQDYYEINRVCRTALYTHHMIYSPGVPVFRDDDDELLPTPYQTSIVTAPAVNAGAVHENEPANVARIEATMRQRIHYLVTIAALHGHETLILGAWGCGVFRQNPAEVADWFHALLTSPGAFQGVFRQVYFAVLDHAPEPKTFAAFAERFAG